MTAQDFLCKAPDGVDTFPEWERIVSQHQVSGKQVHDARLVAAMMSHRVTHILTFNTADFTRYTEITVVQPQSLTSKSG